MSALAVIECFVLVVAEGREQCMTAQAEAVRRNASSLLRTQLGMLPFM